MASSHNANVDVDEEYFQLFNRNFQEEMMCASERYVETVANYFRHCSINRINFLNEAENVGDATDKALQGLLLAALRLSQVMMQKAIERLNLNQGGEELMKK